MNVCTHACVKEVTRLWGMASLKSTRQVGRLETQKRVVAALNQKAAWRQNSFFFGEPQSFHLRPSTDWMRPMHIVEDNLLIQILCI